MTQLLSIHKDNSESENYKAIVEIVGYAEWANVHKCMKLLDWKWSSCDAVPKIQQLMQGAIARSAECVQKSIDSKQDYHTSSGGIDVTTKYFPEGDIALTVKFVLTEWDNYL